MTEIGIAGLSSVYGHIYADRIADRPNASVGGVFARTDDADLDRLGRATPAEFTAAYDCSTYTTVGALAADVDAVIVAGDTTERASDTITALEAGRPVLTAKPAAASPEAAREIAAAATPSTPAVTTTPARFDDAIGGLAERIHRGEIGDVVSVRAAIRHDRVPEAGIDVHPENAPGQPGAVYAMGFYVTDLLLWLTDRTPERVTGSLDNANTPHSEHPDLGSAVVDFPDGTQGQLTMTCSVDCRDPWGNWECEVVGTEGVVRTAHHGYEGIHWSAGDPDQRTTELFARTQSPVLERQFDAFLDTIADGYRRRVPDPTAVARALELCDSWERAAATAESVTLADGD